MKTAVASPRATTRTLLRSIRTATAHRLAMASTRSMLLLASAGTRSGASWDICRSAHLTTTATIGA